MLKFLKKFTGAVAVIFIIPLIMSIACKIDILPEGEQEPLKNQLKTSENTSFDISSAESIDIGETESVEPEITILNSRTKKNLAPGLNTEKENSKEEDSNPQEEITSEENVQEEINKETNEYQQNGYQDVDFSNSEDFRIEVNLSLQRVFIYYKDSLIREMVASGGTEENPTPLGEYTTNEKIEYSFIPRFDMGAYYWVRFYGAYLFHSVPFDEEGNMILEEYEKLGNPASHGCIRLKMDEARWLYDNLPLGVRVLIYYEEDQVIPQT